jgi:putative peptide zinc metalloprotease protein
MFVVMGWMWASRFGEIWSDSFGFFNFTHKSGSDLVEFWFLFGAMAAVHETAHGLVGKHFGATVEKMGFTLMYFAPSFFCDSTQVWVLGGRWARIATAIAGIWLDLVLCFFATVVWWGTAAGMPIHDFSYKVMMVTGLGVSILNLNPLIKLDGYLIFSEFVAEPSLKESATAYLSAWLRRHVFRLPVEVPYLARGKRPFFASYAILSGLYSYSLLSFLMIITYNILHSYTPDWAFVPASLIGVWVFSSRIKLGISFMKIVYLDKKQRVRAFLTPVRTALASIAIAVLVLLPVLPDTVKVPFFVEAGATAVLRAPLTGNLESVSVQEGQTVNAGALLVQLRNSKVDSEAALARSDLAQATARANDAASHYAEFAAAEQERQHRLQTLRIAVDRSNHLQVRSPIAGTVVTPHLSDLVGRPVDEGDLLLKLADFSQVKVNVYIPEFAMHDVRTGQRVRLLVPGRVVPLSAALSSVAPAPSDGRAISPQEELEGINPPRYYLGTVLLKNNGELRPGMMGTGKILVAHRSAAGFALEFLRELVQRKVW